MLLPRRLLQAVAVLAVALFAVLLTPVAVFAQEIPNDAPAVAPVASLTLSAFVVLVVTSFLIPLATGILTKLAASPTVKQVVTLILSAINGLVVTSTQADGTALLSLATAQYTLLSLGIAIVSYLGIYKPHDVNAKLAPEAGFG